MQHTIDIDDRKVIIKKYKVRTTGKQGSTLETSLPKEAFEREARRFGLPFCEALEKLVAVWRFNNFHGLHLSFELAEKRSSENEQKR